MKIRIHKPIYGVSITFLEKVKNYFKIIGNSHTKETTL